MDSALASLRAQIIRDGAPGLEDVEALILLRGGELQPVALKNKRTLRRGALKRIILAALRSGPKTTREIASALQAVKPELGLIG